MNITKRNPLHILTIILLIIITLFGLLTSSGDGPFTYINQYGEEIKIWGEGIYQNDSFFKAPILRGSDLTILITVVPLFIVFLILKLKNNSDLSKYLIASCYGITLYYAASICFGVTYNYLHLAYILLFALSLFGFIYSLLDAIPNEKEMNVELPYKTIYTFLVISGISLIVAWLPDIITSLVEGKSLSLIENYTTEITYVLDMGVIAPVCFITIALLKKRKNIGYPILVMLFVVCSIVGIMVVIQTLFQMSAGISLPIEAIITKIAIFSVLAVFSIILLVISLKKILPQQHS